MKLVIATPCYGNQLYDGYFTAVHGVMDLCRKIGLECERISFADSLVQRARNQLAHTFLTRMQPASDLLFWDADVVGDSTQILNMVGLPYPLVGGAYPHKRIEEGSVIEAFRRGEQYPFKHASPLVWDPLPGEQTICKDGTIPVLGLATGMMRIKREAFWTLQKANPDDTYLSDFPQTRGERVHNFFQCPVEEDRLLSEDYFFSRYAKRAGIESRLFVRDDRGHAVNFGHIGTHLFRGAVEARLGAWK